ncbi:MAG: site-specific integrase, partial [Deltaproteobacteria bacterium]|nr:site-specific integrase [Deltaproteobacteria bacterium]
RKGLIQKRIKAAGKRVGVKAYPHRLRHTSATQLLNAGCRVTSIQRFLGHKRLNTTMVYARVHDQKVAEDYYAAMEEVEKQMVIGDEIVMVPIGADQREQLLKLTEKLADSDLNEEERIKLVEEIQSILKKDT